VRPRPGGAPAPSTGAGAAPSGIGTDAGRPDGIPKVTGEFQYASDLWLDGMIWGVTLRSPHPYARIRSVDIGPALATAGVSAVLTHEDVPGSKLYGLEIVDQPVLAVDTVRYQGEPVALVAADHPEIARQAAKKIVVDWEVLEPVTDARTALGHDGGAGGGAAGEVPRLHPDGNLVRHLRLRKGDPDPVADVVVTGEYHVGMQDQAFLGPESGLAVPAEDGGVELYVATQWLHVDQRQICGALGLPPDKVRLTLAGVGGAFGGREDLSMHVHACLLARLQAFFPGLVAKMFHGRQNGFLQPGVVCSAFEVGQQVLPGDLSGIGVGKVGRQATGSPERIRPRMRGPQQHNAVVPSSFADAPGISKAGGIISNGHAFKVVHDDDHKFNRGLTLIVPDQAGQFIDLGWIEYAGIVIDRALFYRIGDGLRVGADGDTEQDEQLGKFPGGHVPLPQPKCVAIADCNFI
jgi:hypothetical protein